jgi:hypothetical protein
VIMGGKTSTCQPAVGRNKADNREKPRLAQADKIDAEKLRESFDIALKAGDAKPSRTACEELAKAIHLVLESQNKIGNRRNNADVERRQRGVVPKRELKDLSPREEQEKRFRNFQEASSRLLTAIKEVRIAARDIEDNDGSCLWIDKGGVVSIDDLEELLLRACAVPVAARPAPYRPRQIWHGAARSIADLIGTTLRDAGYKKNLNSIDQNSPVAFVGTEVINVAYGAKIRPSGFATAMRNRNRIKKPEADFARLYPDVARIKIL